MQLFKRLLLSYFPDSLVKDSFNPASMFVSFISAKDFFTIIDRKITENYKLNLFDVSMDVFDAKIGLGVHKEMMQSKMSDIYYSYIAAANFNGYKFYNVGNTANALALMIALYFSQEFDEWENQIFVDSLYAFYLLSFIFAWRIKVFPWKNEKEDFQWFIDLYFNFLEVVSIQLKHKVTKKRFQEIRTKLLTHIEVFFMMFYYEQRLNQICLTWDKVNSSNVNDFYQWLFWQQLSATQKTFVENVDTIVYDVKFGPIEQELLFEIAPADIHLKYLFLDTDASEVVSSILGNVYDRKILDKKLAAIVRDSHELDFIVDYVTNPDNFKKWFLKWIKQYISHTRIANQDWFEELDEMMSEIWDDLDKLDQIQIPASIKRESKLMEQFLNFYVSYVWWLSVSRADTFFLRFYKSALIPEIIQYFDIHLKTQPSISFYWISHVLYSKNQSYYQFVSKKIRSWKEKFFIPTTIKSDPVKVSWLLIKSMDEVALATILQDSNPQIWKLYVKNKALLDWFQAQYSKNISSMIKLSAKDFVYHYYESTFSKFPLGENVLEILQNAFTDQDIVRLKNSLYAFDVQLFREVLEMLPWKNMQKVYNDTSMLQILALMRETLFGFLIYYRYLQLIQEAKPNEKKMNLSLLKKTYILQVLNLDNSLCASISRMIDVLLEQFWSAISLFVEFDDNKEFFSLLKENWCEFLKNQEKKTDKDWDSVFSLEDLLWLRWVLKHITYYNKRYLIPN